jgi:hypothetical protein
MFTFVRTHWSKISTGFLLAAVLGLGGVRVYEHFAGDCCQAGSPCCHPGASCCHGRHLTER